LSTQNPVDLDYKGLSNIGTWFIGRLQTTQDIDKVIDGLGGKAGSSFDKNEIRNFLSNLQKRTFFLKSAHLDDIRLFSARWVMSYLKGPLKRDEIALLMQSQKAMQKVEAQTAEEMVENSSVLESYQSIDASIPQYYEPDPLEQNIFSPALGAKATIHFYQQGKGIDTQRSLELFLPLDQQQQHIVWEDASEEALGFDRFPHTSPSNAKFYPLPQIILEDRGLRKAVKELKETLYREQKLALLRCSTPKVESKVGETRSDFIVRVQDILNDQKEIEIEKLQTRYGSKEKTLLDRLARAKERAERESSDATGSMIEAGIAVLGALFGRKSPTNLGRVVTKGGRILKERGEMGRAEERIAAIEEEIEALEIEMEEKIDALHEKYSADNCEIETVSIKPRKTDIDVELCALVWRVRNV
ncbi:MAG TPA: hypothetical protein VLL31_00785, partial [Sulfurovum sp.]|nr:hypothetical protein [Sulfurovum sp.]